MNLIRVVSTVKLMSSICFILKLAHRNASISILSRRICKMSYLIRILISLFFDFPYHRSNLSILALVPHSLQNSHKLRNNILHLPLLLSQTCSLVNSPIQLVTTRTAINYLATAMKRLCRINNRLSAIEAACAIISNLPFTRHIL